MENLGGEKNMNWINKMEEEDDFFGFDDPEQTEQDIDDYIWGGW